MRTCASIRTYPFRHAPRKVTVCVIHSCTNGCARWYVHGHTPIATQCTLHAYTRGSVIRTCISIARRVIQLDTRRCHATPYKERIVHRRRLHTKCVAVRMRHMNHVRTRMHGTPINRLDNAGFPPAMLMVEDVSVLLRIVDAALSLSLSLSSLCPLDDDSCVSGNECPPPSTLVRSSAAHSLPAKR